MIVTLFLTFMSFVYLFVAIETIFEIGQTLVITKQDCVKAIIFFAIHLIFCIASWWYEYEKD